MSTFPTKGGVQEVRPDVARVRTLMANTFLLGEPGGPWVLVDAGLPGFTNTIKLAAKARFGDRRPEAIVLTHGHFDHIGSLGELARSWDVPIFVHALERPYLTGESAYPPGDPSVGGGLMAKLGPMLPPGPFEFGARVQLLPADGSVPGAPGWRWLHTPGHTPGHVSLWRERDRTLIVGDAFVTTIQESLRSSLSERPRIVRRPPAYYTPDWDAARDSVRRLAALHPDVAATGHGEPMSGSPLRSQLDILARDFEILGRPHAGRYSKVPARADEHGVTFVPPPPASKPNVALLAGGALLGLLVLRRLRG